MDNETALRMAGGLPIDEAAQLEYLCAKVLGWQWGEPRPEALPELELFQRSPRQAVGIVAHASPAFAWCKLLQKWITDQGAAR